MTGTRRNVGAAQLHKAAELAACPAHTAMVAAGTDPLDVALRLGAAPPYGQSPTAITRGLLFERTLTCADDDGAPAARLASLLLDGPRTHGDVLDLDRVLPLPAGRTTAGPPDPTLSAVLAARAAATARAVADRHAGRSAPRLVLQADLPLTLGGLRFLVRPDALVATPDGSAYRVAEIKAWPDRGPLTDPTSLGSALGQLAVGALALEQALPQADPQTGGVLVLPDGLGFSPVARHVTFARERRTVSAYGPVLAAAAARLSAASTSAPTADHAAASPVGAAELAHGTRLGDACRARCPLYTACRGRARDDGSPAVLGERAAALLGPLRLGDAGALVEGTSPPNPDEPRETALAAAGRAWRRAVHA